MHMKVFTVLHYKMKVKQISSVALSKKCEFHLCCQVFPCAVRYLKFPNLQNIYREYENSVKELESVFSKNEKRTSLKLKTICFYKQKLREYPNEPQLHNKNISFSLKV